MILQHQARGSLAHVALLLSPVPLSPLLKYLPAFHEHFSHPHEMSHDFCAHCLRACSMREWYPSLAKRTFHTVLVPLDDPRFLAYLDEDGIVLPAPEAAANLSPLDPRFGQQHHVVDGSDGPPPPVFLALERAIIAGIEACGGAAFPKLDWTAPADATWVAPSGNLRCTTAGEIYLLLKSSDLARYDLDLARKLASAAALTATNAENVRGDQQRGFTPCLALRTWYSVHASGEFRCFIRGRKLVGISQRHTGQSFEYLNNAEVVSKMRSSLHDFFEAKIKANFPLRDYVFDAYVDRRGRPWLVDFAPFGYDTDSLLFSWDELTGQNQCLACCEHALSGDGEANNSNNNSSVSGSGSGTDNEVPFRTVSDAPPMGFAPLAQHRYPDDLLSLAAANASGNGGADSDNNTPQGRGGDIGDIIDRLQRQGLFQSGGDDDGSDSESGGDEGDSEGVDVAE